MYVSSTNYNDDVVKRSAAPKTSDSTYIPYGTTTTSY